MTETQKERLIEALEIRMKQFEANFNGDDVKYPLNDGHHTRDVMTVLAVLKNQKSADALLVNMSTKKDSPA